MGYWGLSSEQSIEVLHAMINEDHRKLAAVKDRRVFFYQIAKYQYLRNYYFDKQEKLKTGNPENTEEEEELPMDSDVDDFSDYSDESV